MLAAPDSSKIKPLRLMREEDPYGILFLSDLVQEFHNRSPDKISNQMETVGVAYKWGLELAVIRYADGCRRR